MDHIGEYLVRVRDSDDVALTKAHRIETRVADRFTTHCGREFGPVEGTHLVFYVAPPDGERCSRD